MMDLDLGKARKVGGTNMNALVKVRGVHVDAKEPQCGSTKNQEFFIDLVIFTTSVTVLLRNSYRTQIWYTYGAVNENKVDLINPAKVNTNLKLLLSIILIEPP